MRAFNKVQVSAPSNAACKTAPTTSTTAATTGTTAPTPSSPTETSSPTPPPSTTSTSTQWSDYLISLKMRSTDDDALGVMFRYQDGNNYYRFSWNAQGKARRLEKRILGTFYILAQDTVAYTKGQTYFVQIAARGSSLTVTIDGKPNFNVSDTSFKTGSIGLYSYYNSGSYFDDVRVQDLVTGNTLLADDFNDANYVG